MYAKYYSSGVIKKKKNARKTHTVEIRRKSTPSVYVENHTGQRAFTSFAHLTLFVQCNFKIAFIIHGLSFI